MKATFPLETWPGAVPETAAPEEFDAWAPAAGAFTQMASPKGLYGSHRVVPPAVRAVALWTGEIGRVTGAGLATRDGSVRLSRWVSVAKGSATAVLRPPLTVCVAAAVFVMVLSR